MPVARPSRHHRAALRVALVFVLAMEVAGTATASADPLADADATVQALREQADRASADYFDALARAAKLDSTIAGLERQLPELVRQRRQLRVRARRRAVVAYMHSGRQLAILLASDDALTASRRRDLLAQLNARDAQVFTKLSDTTRRIQERRRRLRDARAAQEQTVAELDQRGRDIDATLQAALDRRNGLQAEVDAAAAAQTTAPSDPAPTDVTVSTAPAEVPTTPPPGYHPTPGTHPHHDDPFLACTRARESGGNYAAVNKAGPYLGAYQVLQSTWNSGANHAGRLELVGVPPNTASEYDQDDIAWAVYQWRGKAPWGEGC
ncbi:MAG TPA: transglycosylase family protein [Acidimicrobiia bacterium]